MDPDANLREQRSIADEIITVWDNVADDGTLTESQCVTMAFKAQRLAELVQALDGWLSRSGRQPRAWLDTASLVQGWQTIDERPDAVYVRLPEQLRRPCDGCDCQYCKAHPERTPSWDTLAIVKSPGPKATTWTVHMPDPRPRKPQPEPAEPRTVSDAARRTARKVQP